MANLLLFCDAGPRISQNMCMKHLFLRCSVVSLNYTSLYLPRDFSLTHTPTHTHCVYSCDSVRECSLRDNSAIMCLLTANNIVDESFSTAGLRVAAQIFQNKVCFDSRGYQGKEMKIANSKTQYPHYYPCLGNKINRLLSERRNSSVCDVNSSAA